MEITQNQQAINLAALLFVRGGFSLESGLLDGEISALNVLKQVKAVIAGQVNASDAMCAFCGLYRGPIFRSDKGLIVQRRTAVRFGWIWPVSAVGSWTTNG